MNAMHPTVLTVDPDVHEALWAQFVAPVIDGTDRFVRQLTIAGLKDPTPLFPFDSIAFDMETTHGRWVLADTTSWAALAITSTERDASIWVRAASSEALAKAVAEVRANTPAVDPPVGVVPVDFWQVTRGATTTTRSIEAPDWSAISHHYPAPVGERLTELMGHEPSLDDGRIVLWYGPPGTGKTTAIRALARAWRDKARFQVVLDPDAILQQAARLMEVLLDEPDADGTGPVWRVLVIEDADELVRSDAKDRVGQSLSRLLNVGDGIVGQGVRLMVLITTNERIDRVHPALARPGRCLAQIEFRRFTRAETATWATGELPAGNDFSLAELLAGGVIKNTEPAPSPGQYL